MTTRTRNTLPALPRYTGVLAALAGVLAAPGTAPAQVVEPPPAEAAPPEVASQSTAEELRVALAAAVAEVRAATQAGIPFRLPARLAAVDAISASLERGALAEALDGLWNFLEYEVARAGSNELARQEVTLEGQPVPAEVVRLGLVELFPLDMFPAGVVDSLFVGKSYLPVEPGEFGGGSVRVRTLAFPTEPLVKVSARMCFRPGTTFAQGLTYQGGSLDWLGVDDGARALPDSVAAASADQPLLQRDMFSDRGYTAEELEAFGEAMPDVWATGRSTVLPAGSVGLALGNRFRLGERGRLGVVAAFGYSATWWTTTTTPASTASSSSPSGRACSPASAPG